MTDSRGELQSGRARVGGNENRSGVVRIPGLRRVHCSYHKCLTVYFEKILKRMAQAPFGLAGAYRHFDSRLDSFYRECEGYTVASVNNHAIDLDRFDDIRVTRFVRDPRDLIVSGYFFHKRSKEAWCGVADPTTEDWAIVNGVVPESLKESREGITFRAYLNEASLEEGLLAELAFRRRHFESMRDWCEDDDRVRVFRYEDLLGNEAETFDRIFRFYGLPFVARRIGRHYAHRFRADHWSRRSDHIRDPRIGQWREVLPRVVRAKFDQEFGDLIERLGYAPD